MARIPHTSALVDELISEQTKKCGTCGKDFKSDTLRSLPVKEGRKRLEQDFCQSCAKSYLNEFVTIHITIPRRLEFDLEEKILDIKESNQTSAIGKSEILRKGAEMVFKALKDRPFDKI